jgi:hypothetical protein
MPPALRAAASMSAGPGQERAWFDLRRSGDGAENRFKNCQNEKKNFKLVSACLVSDTFCNPKNTFFKVESFTSFTLLLVLFWFPVALSFAPSKIVS